MFLTYYLSIKLLLHKDTAWLSVRLMFRCGGKCISDSCYVWTFAVDSTTGDERATLTTKRNAVKRPRAEYSQSHQL